MDPNELFDVVDEDDRVVGQATRRECHERRLIHRSSMMLVLDGKGCVYTHRRAAGCDLSASEWSIAFGGHLQAGEDYDTACRRELLEEAGLTDSVIPIGDIRKRVPEEKENARVYVAIASREPRIQPEEIECLERVPIESVDAWLAAHLPCVPETPQLLELLRSYLRSVAP